MRIGQKFLDNYFSPGMESILEVGSFDVNGSLKSVKPLDSKWIGMDIEKGPGVDVVNQPGEKFPFPDEHFDLVVATSVFEHDPAFWKTLSEMARVVKKSGFLYISAPSNGMVHRYPLDCFRFYPDASQSFLQIVKDVVPNSFLSESFVGDQDHEQMWNDYVAVIGMNSASVKNVEKIYKSEMCSNIWDDDLFIQASLVETPEDRRNAERLAIEVANTATERKALNDYISKERDAVAAERDAVAAERDAVAAERDAVAAERDAIAANIEEIYKTKTFRWTKRMRSLFYLARKFINTKTL
jgi:SAM-dependent methyltransferase